jgi:hypothetical protein
MSSLVLILGYLVGPSWRKPWKHDQGIGAPILQIVYVVPIGLIDIEPELCSIEFCWNVPRFCCDTRDALYSQWKQANAEGRQV